jgi:RNA polymerase sigma-70 factor (ECF subfamily)
MSADDDRRIAFETLFATHYWVVRGYVRRRSPSSAVDDVVAETFLAAWRRFDSVAEDPLPWLLGVSRRILANQHRAERRRTALATRLRSLRSGSAWGWEAPVEMSEELAMAMASLSEREREALLLVAWEGLEPNRAARAAGCTPATFRVRLHRARRRVAAQLADSPAGHTNSTILEEAP